MSQLRALTYIDRLQPQFASYMGKFSQGYLPVAGMTAAVVEVAPGIEINWVLDAALKAAQIKPGLMTVERHFGILEFHAPNQAEVKHAVSVILNSLDCGSDGREIPRILSSQIIRKVDPHHAQMINSEAAGSLLLPGLDMFIMECGPAGYIGLAANEAEKSAQVTLVDCNMVGAEGRLIMSGKPSDVARACQAAQAALKGLTGRQPEAGS